jgi:N-acetylneuraminate synthase
MAHCFIDAVASTGADAVKFQTHIAPAESTLDEPWRVKFSLQDETRFDYWRRMEFSEEQWIGLAEHAKDKGLIFLSSPFSVAAVRLLNSIGVPFWKVPSGELTNPELLEAIFKTKLPVLFSSGMSSFAEIDAALEDTRRRGVAYALLQCVSKYPCDPEFWGLNMISEFKARYDCPVGFSDHSGTIYAGLAAAALGADFIEVHVCFSKQMFGPDIPASITFEGLRMLVDGARFIRNAIDTPVDKDNLSASLAPIKRIFGRSLALQEPLASGTVLSQQNLTLKKPGGGIPYGCLPQVVGKRLAKDTRADRLLAWEDLE